MQSSRVIIPLFTAACLALSACASPLPSMAPSRASNPPPAALRAPTQTPRPQPTPSSTPGPRLSSPPASATASKSPSQVPTITIFPRAPDEAHRAGKSADGKWQWQLEEGPPGDENLFILHLTRLDGKQEWRVQMEPNRFHTTPPGTSKYYLPFFWMPKEPFVFLIGQTCCGEHHYFFETGFRLSRLNLQTGLVTDFFPSYDPSNEYYFSFSPTGQFLLYTQPQIDNDLHLYRLSSGEVSTIALSATQDESGWVTWAPDESEIGLLSCRTRERVPEIDTCPYTFWVVDLNSRQARLLVSDLEGLKTGPNDFVKDFFWLSLSRISIHMVSGAAWVVNLVSGELTCRGADNMPCQPYLQPTSASQ